VVKCSGVLQCSGGLSNEVSNIIRSVVKCSGVLQCSDGLSNKVSNIIRSLMDNTKCGEV